MISLLAPISGLALAAAAAVPLAVHLLTRQTRQARVFPALAFVQAAHAGQARMSRLRRWLVLLLRVLAVMALVAAWAGPQWSGETTVAGAPLVVIVDGSASTRATHQGTTAFSANLAAARQLVDGAGGRPVLVLVAGDTLERSAAAPAADAHAARALLVAAQPGWGEGTLRAAMEAALAALKDGGDLYLVSDGTRGSWTAVDAGRLPGGIAWHPVATTAGAANVAVRAIAAAPGIALAGRPLRVEAEIVNYGARTVQAEVALTVGGERRDLRLSVPAGGTALAGGTFIPTVPGPGAPAEMVLEAAITALDAPDAWADDDRRTGTVAVVPAMPVTVISDGRADDPRGALKPVLAALAAAGMRPRLGPGAVLIENLTQEREAVRRVLVTVALAGLRPGDAAALQGHLLAGGAWLQVIASPGDAAACRALPDLPAPLLPGAVLSPAAGVRLGQARFDHPLLVAVRGRESLLGLVEGWRLRSAVAGEGATVLIAWADGSPALAERGVAAGRWLSLNIDPADDATSLAASDLLPLLLEPLGRVLLPGRRADCALACGTGFAAPAALRRSPDGPPLPAFDGMVQLSAPGLLHQDGHPPRLFAAAIPAGESDLRAVPAPVRQASGDADLAAALASQQRTPLWPWLLLLVLALLAGELLLAGGPAATRKAAT